MSTAQDSSSYHCPECGHRGRWRRGVHFDHEMICTRCGFIWEPQPEPVRDELAAIRDERDRFAGLSEMQAKTVEALAAKTTLLQSAARTALAHVRELRDAWQRGCISETDNLGGTRSNRNVEVETALRQALGEP